MEIRELTCIGCPMGCSLTVKIDDFKVITVTGNTCKIGENYAKKEMTDPRRIVTSTVLVKDGEIPCVSVKTKSDIPKDKIMECMKALKGVSVQAPVQIGDIIVKNIVDTGIDVVATKQVLRKC